MPAHSAQATSPAKRKSMVQRVRERLEDDIIEGRLAPGAQLHVDDIAAQCQVSRTPVREALQQLASSGLVKVQPKRGTYVAALSVSHLIEMFEVMAELEACCAQLAARRADAGTRQALSEAVAQCERQAQAGEPNAYYDANEVFHQLIYHASGNGYLAQQTVALRNRLKPYRRLQLQVRDRMGQSVAEHRALLDAIQSGDAKAASNAARDHVLVQGQRFNDLMSLVSQRQMTSD
jgi:DNA-binding GntR family transcriptional regulator